MITTERLDFHTYHQARCSSRYDNQTAQDVVEWVSRLQSQEKTSIFNPFDPSPSSFSKIRLSWLVTQLASMKVQPLGSFTTTQASTILITKIALKAKSLHKRQKEETLTAYFQVVSYLLNTYSTDHLVGETHTEIIRSLNRRINLRSSTLNCSGPKRYTAIDGTASVY